MQLLFSTGKSFTVDGLREKLREFYSDKVRAEVRDLAALNNVKLITALLSSNRQLTLVGLQRVSSVRQLCHDFVLCIPWMHRVTCDGNIRSDSVLKTHALCLR